MIFCNANATKFQTTQRLLDSYELASSQGINKHKSGIFFSLNTKGPTRNHILDLAKVPAYSDQEKYLGLPLIVGSKKYRTFEEIKDKVWRRISNWKNTFLSQARKEVLLKFVVQAIPTYTMSLFWFPQKICHLITSSMSHFWWGNMTKQKGVHWKRWELLDDTKSQGGIGFRELEAFNKALLAKQIGRILQNPSSLVGQIL